jgi:hypothetical protein
LQNSLEDLTEQLDKVPDAYWWICKVSFECTFFVHRR